MLGRKSELQLEDDEMIGGAYRKLIFTVCNDEGELLDLNECGIAWALSHVGQNDNPLIVKNSSYGEITVIGLGEFVVELSGEDTIDLESSKYEHEYLIFQPNGKIHRPSWGYITIKRGGMFDFNEPN